MADSQIPMAFMSGHISVALAPLSTSFFQPCKFFPTVWSIWNSRVSCLVEYNFTFFSSDSLSRYVRHGTRWPKPCPQLKATTTTASALDSFLTTAWQPAAPDYTPTWHVTTQLTARHHLKKGESAQCVVVQLKLQISLCLRIIFLTLLRRAKIFHRKAPYTIDRSTNISLRLLTLTALSSQ